MWVAYSCMHTHRFTVKKKKIQIRFLLSPAFSPVPILFRSLLLSKCSEEPAESLMKEVDCTLGDRPDNEMVGGRNCESDTY